MSELYAVNREIHDDLLPAIGALAAKIHREEHLRQIPPASFVEIAPLVLSEQDPIDANEVRPIPLGGTHRRPNRILPDAADCAAGAIVAPRNSGGDVHRIFGGVYFGGPTVRATRLTFTPDTADDRPRRQTYLDVTASGHTLEYPYEDIAADESSAVDERSASANNRLDIWAQTNRRNGIRLGVIGPHITSYARFLRSEDLSDYYQLLQAVATAGEQEQLATPPLYLVEGLGEIAASQTYSGVGSGSFGRVAAARA